MKKEKEKFIKGCGKNGITNSLAEKIWSLIEKFVGYGFNKAHSASYGLIAYQTAYMKVKYPVEFMTAVLAAESRGSSGPARDEKIAQAILECRRMKISLLGPDINKSKVEFSIENENNQEGSIRFGLSAIKNVGTASIDSILQARNGDGNFKSLSDFLKRVDLSKVNRKTIESLIKSGAMDAFGKRAALLSVFSEMVDKISRNKTKKNDGQFALFELTEDELTDNLPDIEELSRDELLLFEKLYLGFYITEHPLSAHIKDLEKKVTHRINSLTKSNNTVIIGGIITQIKKITTKNSGAEMAFVKIDDFTGSCELVVFPKIFERTKFSWNPDKVILVKGKVSEKEDRLSVLVDDVKPLHID